MAENSHDSTATAESDVLRGASAQFAALFDTSEQPIYLYLDDTHKACNERFASLLGYDSAAEWAAVDENFPTAFVAEDSRHTLIHAYRAAMNDGVASAIRVAWEKRDGERVPTRVILVPVECDGRRLALHFVTDTS